MKQITLPIEGKNVTAWVEKIAGVLWVHLNGRTFTFESPKKDRARSGNSAIASGDVLAPMPGKIIKVLVRQGEAVKASQVLLVMEAMKMEYTLKASIDGTIAQIKCQAGDQVALSQQLVKIE